MFFISLSNKKFRKPKVVLQNICRFMPYLHIYEKRFVLNREVYLFSYNFDIVKSIKEPINETEKNFFFSFKKDLLNLLEIQLEFIESNEEIEKISYFKKSILNLDFKKIEKTIENAAYFLLATNSKKLKKNLARMVFCQYLFIKETSEFYNQEEGEFIFDFNYENAETELGIEKEDFLDFCIQNIPEELEMIY